MTFKKRDKKKVSVASIVVISAVVALLFAALVSRVPAILDSTIPTEMKPDLRDNEDLIRVLQGNAYSKEDGKSQLAKLDSVFYKPDGEYYVSIEMYEQNIRFLAENGYSTMTLKEFVKTVRSGEKVPPKTVLLYSDTTKRTFYNLAFPVLKKYGFTATIGLATDEVNTPGNLDLRQLAEMEDYGIEISSHSMTHPDLTTISDGQLQMEMVGSKNLLEVWGFDVETFIYPYGAHDERVIQAAKDAGYIGARATGGAHLSDGGGYASFDEALLYSINAGLPVKTTSIEEFQKYVLNEAIEIEDIYQVKNETGNNAQIARVLGDDRDGLGSDSFASISLPDTGDAIKLNIFAPQSGQYDLHFRVKTGSYVSGSKPTGSEDSYEYIINGQAYSRSSGTVRTTGPYENESTTSNVTWGYQHIDNVGLQEGANTVAIASTADWAIVDFLSVDARDNAQEIAAHNIPSIDYDGIFYESPKTSVILGMHGYEHQNPYTGSLGDEFSGLSRQETLGRIEKSNQLFKDADLSPTFFIPPGEQKNVELPEVLADKNLAMSDFPLYEGTWLWRNMKSFDDPRFNKTWQEMVKERPKAILLHIQDYNRFTKKLLADYVESVGSPVIVRVDDITSETSASDIESLLDLKNLHYDRMHLILGITPKFPAVEQTTGIAGVFKSLWKLFLISMVFLNIFFVCLATAHRLLNRRKRRAGLAQYADGGGLPKISIVTPMYNEGESARKVIHHALDQTYLGPIELLLVDDGSSDNTFDVIESEAVKHENVIAMRQRNRGKPAALNKGFKAATGEIVISTDGDSFLDKNAVERIVERFLDDPEVGAVAGFVKVINESDSWITRFSQIEYTKEQALFRGCQGISGDVVICPGPIFAARRQLLIENPSSDRTIVEDCEQTVQIRKSGWKVIYAPDAISETMAPTKLKDWINQRRRWFYGYLQVWQLIKRFALKKPWMVYWYLGYPMTIMALIILAAHLILMMSSPEPYVLLKLFFYLGFGLSFSMGTYLYAILLLSPVKVKKSTLLWLPLYPFYEAMVMIMRAYLYLAYLRKDGPIIKFGPRTIHALPDRSVVVAEAAGAIASDKQYQPQPVFAMASSKTLVTEPVMSMAQSEECEVQTNITVASKEILEGENEADTVVAVGSRAILAGESKELLLGLLHQGSSNTQRREMFHALSQSQKTKVKKLLGLAIRVLHQDTDEEQRRETFRTLCHSEKMELKRLLEELLNKSNRTQANPDDIEKTSLSEEAYLCAKASRDQDAFLARQKIANC